MSAGARRSIRLHLVTLILGVALPLFGVLVWGFWTELERERRDSRDLALRIAHAIADDLRESNTRADALLTRMAGRPKVRAGNPADCDSLFPIVDFFPQYLNLQLYDVSGELLCSAEPLPEDAPFSRPAEAAIRTFLTARKPIPVDPMIMPVKQRWLTIAFRPLHRGGKSTVLVLYQYLDFNIDASPRGTVITIVDEDGRVIARSLDPEQWIGQIGRNRVIGHPLRREGSAELEGIDGVVRQYGFTPVRGTHWRLFVGIPARVATAALRLFIIRGSIAGLLIVALIVFASLRFSRSIERPLAALASAARRVEDSGYSSPVPTEGPREVAWVGEAFNRMVVRRAEAEAALVDSKNQLEALSNRLLVLQEEERTRIAREIHDELGQRLTALKIDVGGLIQALPERDDLQSMVGRIRRNLDDTVSSIRRIAAELRPPALDDFGFLAALEADVRMFEERTGIECDLSLPAEAPDLPPGVETTAYRIVQEAMTNVARHANASRVEIRLRVWANEMLVDVRDDGRGVSDTDVDRAAGLGIIGMRERARLIGGTLDVQGIPGKGTIVSLRIRIARGAEATV
jgi:signal transduction histidine kinase